MDEEQKSINEILSGLKIEDIKQDDLAWSCIEDVLNGQSIHEYDVFPHEDKYFECDVYQKSEFYNPFAASKKNIV